MKSIAHGNIAIQIAIRHPGRVRKLVVASAMFKIDELEPEEDTEATTRGHELIIQDTVIRLGQKWIHEFGR